LERCDIHSDCHILRDRQQAVIRHLNLQEQAQVFEQLRALEHTPRLLHKKRLIREAYQRRQAAQVTT
jgi:hypothetical protein